MKELRTIGGYSKKCVKVIFDLIKTQNGKKDKKTDTAFSEADLMAGLRSWEEAPKEDILLTDLVQRVVNAALDAEGEAHIARPFKTSVCRIAAMATRASKSRVILARSQYRLHGIVRGPFEPELIGKWQR
ncbi:MAG: hypothetical protein R3B47_11925 [Bacteroidia bacterium]